MTRILFVGRPVCCLVWMIRHSVSLRSLGRCSDHPRPPVVTVPVLRGCPCRDPLRWWPIQGDESTKRQHFVVVSCWWSWSWSWSWTVIGTCHVDVVQTRLLQRHLFGSWGLAVKLTSRFSLNCCSRVTSTASLRVQADIRELELLWIRDVSRHRPDPVRSDSSRARTPSSRDLCSNPSFLVSATHVLVLSRDVLYLNVVLVRFWPRIFLCCDSLRDFLYACRLTFVLYHICVHIECTLYSWTRTSTCSPRPLLGFLLPPGFCDCFGLHASARSRWLIRWSFTGCSQLFVHLLPWYVQGMISPRLMLWELVRSAFSCQTRTRWWSRSLRSWLWSRLSSWLAAGIDPYWRRACVISLIKMFYGQVSTYFWEDDEEVFLTWSKEQEESMMFLLHVALIVIQGSLGPEELLMTFLDDLYVVTPIDCGICMGQHNQNCGRTLAFASRDARPGVEFGRNAAELCDILERIVQATDPEARVWRESGLPTEQWGIRVLQHTSVTKISSLRICKTVFGVTRRGSTASPSWALLLHCASVRLNFMLRVVRLELVGVLAEGHAAGLWACLCRLLNVSADSAEAKVIVSIPLSLDGLDLFPSWRSSRREAVILCGTSCALVVSHSYCVTFVFTSNAHSVLGLELRLVLLVLVSVPCYLLDCDRWLSCGLVIGTSFIHVLFKHLWNKLHSIFLMIYEKWFFQWKFYNNW